MATGSVLAFWLVALLLIAVPGADWAFTIGAGLRGHSVLPAVAGLVTGYAAITAVVAAGVGALVAGSPAALTGLTLVGGLYLVWHGATTFARPPATGTPGVRRPGAAGTLGAAGRRQPGKSPVGRGGRGVFLTGIGVSGLNPKGLLIFLALLPQFTSVQAPWPVAGQIVVLGLAFIVTCAGFYLGLGAVARTVLHARPGLAGAVGRVAGAGMVAVGVSLIIDRLVG